MTTRTASNAPSGARATTWGLARRNVAILALLTAMLTTVAGNGLGGLSWPLYGAVGYVGLTLLALFHARVILPQLVAGQVLCASVLFAAGGPDPIRLLPVVASLVATAELLAIVARLGAPVARDPRPDLRRAGLAVVLGASAFGAIALVGRIPGETGLGATSIAVCALVALAFALARSRLA